jgi:hypothetical protein
MAELQKNTLEKSFGLELNLGWMAIHEQLKFKDQFKEYGTTVVLLLTSMDKYLLEADVKKQFNSDDIENILNTNPHLLKTNAFIKNADGTLIYKYMHIAESYDVQPDDLLYDYFFAYKLRELTLQSVDAFLDYHLHFYYNHDVTKYVRFLKLCLRTHTDKISKETLMTAEEWIEEKLIQDKHQKEVQQEKRQQALFDIKAQQSESLAEPELKIKGKYPKREAHDDLTTLNQEQTVLLIHYLQQKKVVLKDEYLTNKNVGIAFELLTGYSQNTLRQDLSKQNHFKSKLNLKALDNVLTAMKLAIDKDLKETKF